MLNRTRPPANNPAANQPLFLGVTLTHQIRISFHHHLRTARRLVTLTHQVRIYPTIWRSISIFFKCIIWRRSKLPELGGSGRGSRSPAFPDIILRNTDIGVLLKPHMGVIKQDILPVSLVCCRITRLVRVVVMRWCGSLFTGWFFFAGRNQSYLPFQATRGTVPVGTTSP